MNLSNNYEYYEKLKLFKEIVNITPETHPEYYMGVNDKECELNSGCEYCEDAKYIIKCREPFKPNIDMYIVDNGLMVNSYTPLGEMEELIIEIKYCPMCGDELRDL